MILGNVLLQGLGRGVFLMSQVPLYTSVNLEFKKKKKNGRAKSVSLNRLSESYH